MAVVPVALVYHWYRPPEGAPVTESTVVPLPQISFGVPTIVGAFGVGFTVTVTGVMSKQPAEVVPLM
ncbi:hypothetical protein [uncultured Pontibacter sp.]|uniref:hypothetical protein n=1 Tax=uncultured Pontibacter sp. TaxID=453356 RepID=UPI0026298F1A|nr:hypothetical protein [uncultured Pontibacter sp.]